MADKFKIRREEGENLEQIIAQNLVKSPVVVIKELGSNSHDADAEEVKVKLDYDNLEVVVEDDGTGMSEEKLEGFKRMGDSERLEKPKTAKGRNCIGQFGIATVLLGYLGDSYDIETWTKGSYIEGREIFGSGRGLEYNVHENPSGKHGTKITVHNVQALTDGTLGLKKLANALTWEMPNQDDMKEGDRFLITLNWQPMIRTNPKPSQEFQFAENLGFGEVKIAVDYFEHAPNKAGVYLFVDKRAIGEGSFVDLRRYKVFGGRVYARIDADGLKGEILFDREEVQEVSPHFRALTKWTNTKLLEVRRAIESGIARVRTVPKVLPTTPEIQKAMQTSEVRKGLNRILDNEPVKPRTSATKNYREPDKEPERNLARLKPQGGNLAKAGFVGFHTSRKGPLAQHLEIDSASRQITYNPDHPLYDSPEITTKDLMKNHVLLGTCFAFPESKSVSEDYRTQFNDLCVKLLAPLSALEQAKERVSRIHRRGSFVSSKRYEIREAVEMLGISLSTLHKIVEAGVLAPVGDRFLGSDLNVYLNISANHTPACAIMEGYARGREVSRQRIAQYAEKIDDMLVEYKEVLPFLVDVGKKHPFFLIPNEQVPGFQGLYAQGAIARKGEDSNFDVQGHILRNRALFEQVVGTARNEYVPLEELCTFAKLTPTQILKIIGYSQRQGGRLNMRFDGNKTVYSFADFQKVRERFLRDGS